MDEDFHDDSTSNKQEPKSEGKTAKAPSNETPTQKRKEKKEEKRKMKKEKKEKKKMEGESLKRVWGSTNHFHIKLLHPEGSGIESRGFLISPSEVISTI